ncbi:MAG: patatin family protein [Firmicutes bacterium]|nr:patatin family protein [Bacillota bacterium]
MSDRPKIGLALGAGSARGIAHLGVLRVLEKYKIPIDYIAGTSMGALIGGLYSFGLDVEFMIKFASELQSRSWIDLTVPRQGFVRGDKIQSMLQLLTKNQRIEDLPRPFAAVATDIERGEPVVLSKGALATAIRASISIPVVFKPISIDDKLLVDGGIVDRVPVSVVRQMGADVIIAVDVNKFVAHQPVRNMFDVMFQTIDIMERKIMNTTILDTDILIRPQVGHISPAHFHRVDELVAEGEQAAVDTISTIGYVLKKKRSEFNPQ